jgi:hypothetical protein
VSNTNTNTVTSAPITNLKANNKVKTIQNQTQISSATSKVRIRSTYVPPALSGVPAIANVDTSIPVQTFSLPNQETLSVYPVIGYGWCVRVKDLTALLSKGLVRQKGKKSLNHITYMLRQSPCNHVFCTYAKEEFITPDGLMHLLLKQHYPASVAVVGHARGDYIMRVVVPAMHKMNAMYAQPALPSSPVLDQLASLREKFELFIEQFKVLEGRLSSSPTTQPSTNSSPKPKKKVKPMPQNTSSPDVTSSSLLRTEVIDLVVAEGAHRYQIDSSVSVAIHTRDFYREVYAEVEKSLDFKIDDKVKEMSGEGKITKIRMLEQLGHVALVLRTVLALAKSKYADEVRNRMGVDKCTTAVTQ